MKKVVIRHKKYSLKQPFVISRGIRTHAEVIECQIEENGNIGLGECTPYPRYAETAQSVMQQIKQWTVAIEQNISREQLEKEYPAGSARHAVDAALWDFVF